MIVDNLFTDDDIKQILGDQKLRELIEKLDLPYIIQILKEYGFAIANTTEIRYKVAGQVDHLQKLRDDSKK